MFAAFTLFRVPNLFSGNSRLFGYTSGVAAFTALYPLSNSVIGRFAQEDFCETDDSTIW